MGILDPETIITSGGLALIAFIVFAESGLLFGFFFPGDTLLFLAGTLAAQGQFNIVLAIVIITISAALGGNVGYVIGKRTGKRIFKKKDGLLFRHEYIEHAERFYEKHGGKTVMLARFIPVGRTFAPIVAGMGNMDQKRFNFYNIVGSIVWGVGVTLAGYIVAKVLGEHVPDIDKFILPVVAVVTLFTFASPLIHIAKDPKSRALFVKKLKRLFNR